MCSTPFVLLNKRKFHFTAEPLQHAVPPQAADQAAQVGEHHRSANALQAVHAAKEANRRHAGVGVAQRDGVQRHRLGVAGHLTDHAVLQQGAAFVDDVLQFGQFGGVGRGHANAVDH